MKSRYAKQIHPLLSACAVLLAGMILLHASSTDDQAAIPSSAPKKQAGGALPERMKNSDELYRLLDESRQQYEDGIQLIIEGNATAGEEKIKAAQDRLLSAAHQCTRSQDCEVERFFDVIAELWEMKQSAASNDASESTEPALDTDDENGQGLTFSPVEAVLPDVNRTPPLFRGKDLSELIDLNEPVKAALNDWLTRMRPNLMESFENYLFLRSAMAPVYQEAGLPEALLFGIIATETGGVVHAYSRAGAAGPLQFMRNTGRRYGLRVEDGFDMRYDPVASVKANVSYLNEQLEVLHESLEKTLAAYNGGENRLQKLNRRFKGADFWDSRFYNSLPRETRRYVPRVLAAAWLFLHPEDYNLQFPRCQTETSALTIQQDTSLDELSICFGQDLGQSNGWFRTLRNLNPRLEPEKPIKSGTEIEIPAGLKQTYNEKCIQGELINRARELHKAKYPEMLLYTVGAGDTLEKIAARYQCASQKEIGAINNLRGPKYMIRIGQTLKIPGCN
jgi:membrane-bound lytic murein transglycosylase D